MADFDHLKQLTYFKDIKFLSKDDWGRVVKLSTTDNSDGLTITVNPTLNCQFISIGYVEALLHQSNSVDSLAELLYIIKKSMMTKPMIMLDVYTKSSKQFLELFTPFLKGEPRLNQPYLSTSGSNMTLMLLPIKWELIDVK